MQYPCDFDGFFGYAIENNMRMDQDGAQPGYQFIPRTAHERVPSELAARVIDVAQQSVGHVDRSDTS